MFVSLGFYDIKKGLNTVWSNVQTQLQLPRQKNIEIVYTQRYFPVLGRFSRGSYKCSGAPFSLTTGLISQLISAYRASLLYVNTSFRLFRWIKWPEIVKNATENCPEPKVMSLNSLLGRKKHSKT